MGVGDKAGKGRERTGLTWENQIERRISSYQTNIYPRKSSYCPRSEVKWEMLVAVGEAGEREQQNSFGAIFLK